MERRTRVTSLIVAIAALSGIAQTTLATDVFDAPGPLRGPGAFGFSGNSGTDSLTVFDLTTGMPVGLDVDLLPEGDYPYDVTLHPDGTEVWIAGAVGDGVLVVDTTSHAITERISLAGTAEYPVDIAFDGDGGVAYVASRDNDLIAVIDTSTYMVVDTIPIAASFLGPGKMAFSATRNELYVVEWFDDELYVIDAATQVVTPFSIGNDLWDLVLDPAEDTLYVADRGNDEVHVFDLDTQAVTDSVTVGDDPWGIDRTPDGARLVVANEDDNTLTVIDTATLGTTTVTLPAGADPRDVDITSGGDFAYIPSGDVPGDDGVYVLDLGTLTITGTVSIGGTNANALAVHPEGPEFETIFADSFTSGDTSAWTFAVP